VGTNLAREHRRQSAQPSASWPPPQLDPLARGKDHRRHPAQQSDGQDVRADAGADDRRHRNVGGRGDLAVGNHPHELLGNGPVEQRHYQAHLGQQMFDQERITQSDDVATYEDGHCTDSLRQSCTHLRVRRTQEVGDHKPVRG